jgi:rubrerythrin
VTAADADRGSPRALLESMGAPLDEHAYDWNRATAQRLTQEELFQLTYASQVEWATEGTFQSLDITEDPTVKRFLRTWLAQEVVHGRLLARFLEAYGQAVQPLHETLRQRFGARRGRWVNQVALRVFKDDFFAVHMTWGAVNELMTLRFYALMREASENSLLRDLLRDLIAQEVIHYRFYRAVAIEHLDGNQRAQRLVRWSLEHLWSPVGSGLRGRRDSDRLVLGLVADRPDTVARIDGTLETIPGLAGLDLVTREVDRARSRAAHAPTMRTVASRSHRSYAARLQPASRTNFV